MGFIVNKNNIESYEERILFIDIWRSMKGENNEGVLSDNLKIFLGAIEGFKFEISKNNKLHLGDYKIVEKVSPNRRSTSLQHKFTLTSSSSRCKDSTYSKIDPILGQDNIIRLSQSEIKSIQDYYFIFARNRSNHLSNKYHQKQTKYIKEMSKVSHKPSIDTKSRKIIKNLHQKLNESKIPHYEFLLFKGREYEHKIEEYRTHDKNKQSSL